MKIHQKVTDDLGWIGDFIRVHPDGKEISVYGDKDLTLDEAKGILEAYNFDMEALDFHDNVTSDLDGFEQAYVWREFV